MNINDSITSFVNKYYNIEFKGDSVNPDDLSDVTEFLLMDIHTSQGFSALNSLFINTFANLRDVVLIEGILSMKKVKQESSIHSVWLKDVLRILGWDVGNIKDITESQPAQEIADLELQGHVLLKQWMEAPAEKKEELQLQVVEAFEKSIDAQSKFSMDSLTERVVATFPDRVKSMQNSLDIAKKIGRRTFLMAGMEHLKQLNFQHPNFSLDAFHAFLKSRKVVILSPKHYWADRLGSDREERIKDIKEIIMMRKLQQLAAQFIGKGIQMDKPN